MDAAFALNGLDEDGAGLIVDQLARRFEVAEGSVLEAGQHGIQALVVFRLTGGTEGAEGAAVEGVDGGNDLVAPARFAVQPGHLDGCLDRLGAAVTEETLG